MMEVLGAPQTHLGLKAMIKEVDEDDDGRISFREVSLLTKMYCKNVAWQFYCFMNLYVERSHITVVFTVVEYIQSCCMEY